jgi:hypothetical protein
MYQDSPSLWYGLGNSRLATMRAKFKSIATMFTGRSTLPVNVALNGTTSASGAQSGYGPSGVVDGDRKGLNWGSGGGWKDNTSNTWPDWVQITFAGGPKTISRVVVYSLQDNGATLEPTTSMTGTFNVATSFDVKTWNGASWVTQASVTGNQLIKRIVTFPPVTTSQIKIVVNGAQSPYTKIVEVEAF